MKIRVLGTGSSRTQDGVAVSGDSRAWYLVNASPDRRTQLLATPELDRTLGLHGLREAAALDVYATAWVHAPAPSSTHPASLRASSSR